MNIHGLTNIRILVLMLIAALVAILILSFDAVFQDELAPKSVHTFTGQVKHIPALDNIAGARPSIHIQVSDEPGSEDWIDDVIADAFVVPPGVLFQSIFRVDTLVDPTLSDGDFDGAKVLITRFVPNGHLPGISRDSFDSEIQFSQLSPNKFVGIGRLSVPGVQGIQARPIILTPVGEAMNR